MLNFNHLPFSWFWIVSNIYSVLQCHILVQLYFLFILINGYCKVTGLVFIIIDAYYIIETFLNRQRAVFIGGTSRQRRNGQLTMSRKKQCPKLHFSLVWRCKMVERHRNKTGTRSSIMSCTRLTRYLPERSWRRRWILVRVATTVKMTYNLERSFEYEIW